MVSFKCEGDSIIVCESLRLDIKVSLSRGNFVSEGK